MATLLSRYQKPKKQNTSNPYNELLEEYQSARPKANTNAGVQTTSIKSDLLSNYADVMKNIHGLYASKYGIGGYDISKGFQEQSALPKQNWNTLDEAKGLSAYEKHMTDLYNQESAMGEYKDIRQEQASQQKSNAVLKEQAEKYTPQQLAFQGLGSVGSSEIPLGNIENQYINLYNAINKGAEEEGLSMFGRYKQALELSNQNLKTQQNEINQAYFDEGINNLTNEQLLDDDTGQSMNAYLKEFKGKISEDLFKQLVEYAKQVAKEAGWEFVPS
jgi:hypothetical protein